MESHTDRLMATPYDATEASTWCLHLRQLALSRAAHSCRWSKGWDAAGADRI